jgi:hypothetical protein
MNDMKFRDFESLLTVEIQHQAASIVNDVAFVLALQAELTGKDGETEDERLSEGASERVSQTTDLLFLLLNRTDVLAEGFDEALTQSGLFPPELIADIDEVMSYRRASVYEAEAEESNDLESFEENLGEFLRRRVAILRVHEWLSDIASGLEQYGVEDYLVPVDADHADLLGEKEGILKNVDDLSPAEAVKEIVQALSKADLDEDEEELRERKHTLSLLAVAGKYIGGKEDGKR